MHIIAKSRRSAEAASSLSVSNAAPQALQNPAVAEARAEHTYESAVLDRLVPGYVGLKDSGGQERLKSAVKTEFMRQALLMAVCASDSKSSADKPVGLSTIVSTSVEVPHEQAVSIL